ncbi:MAG: LysM peptidoglycan-binding domain-containing protein [Gammaproteobacteria bacterium]|nr:LysM peptidoglycan-binding domain-containing protein [Gammaproteobacteria bacterium]
MSPKPLLGSGFFLLITALFLTSPGIRADVVQLKPDHPERYIVVKGDTLWDISTRFLKSPWHWPQIWKINQEIKNPHLIYPGDVVVLRWVDGKPVLSVERKDTGTGLPSLPDTAPAPVVERRIDERTVRLSPRSYSAPVESAIPTIQPNAIAPFLTRPLAVEEDVLEQAGYITVGLDDRIALGDSSQFYARGLKEGGPEFYQIFRPGNPIRNPDTGELLAYEAVYLGDARLLESGDPSKLVVTGVKQEIIPKDRLLAAPKKASLPYYYPHAPKTKVEGRIVSALNAVSEIGPHTVVGISLGTREGIEEGSVLRVMRHVGTHRDPVTREKYMLPDEESALILVFRTYEKISYALVMTATRPVYLLDAVITP